jgi:hypothetical protein
MRILIACEYSGIVRDAFIAAGHHAVSCDLLPTESGGKGWHYKGDVFDILNDGWDMMICFPECTKLTWANPHVTEEERKEASKFAEALFNAPIDKICLENPRGYLTKVLGPADQELHPWHFGDYYYKRTQIWLKNLPPPTAMVLRDRQEAFLYIQKQARAKQAREGDPAKGWKESRKGPVEISSRFRTRNGAAVGIKYSTNNQ